VVEGIQTKAKAGN